MNRSSNHRFYLRTLFVIAGMLALALFTQLTVTHADPPSPNAPQGASTLGDFVWHDFNVDGVKDGAEWGQYGIDGVVVNLYLDDMDGQFEPGGDDALVGTLTTGDDSSTGNTTEHGWYDFVNITANGNAYWVEIDDSNFAAGGALEGYVYTGNLATNAYNGDEPRLVYLGDPIMDYNDADFGYALPGIQIVKTAGNAADGEVEYIDHPQSVTYTYVVTNTGETYLSDITVTDDQYGTICTISGPLAPNASSTCHYTGNITTDVTNIATATGNPVDSSGTDLPGADVSDTDDAVVDLVSPNIQLVKTADNAADGDIDYINSGDDVVYHYAVTNTGDTYLSNIVITDDNGTPGDANDDFTVCTIAGPLAPNASASCDHTVSNVTADVTNTATATANPTDSNGNDLPDINDVSDNDDAVVVLYASIGDFVWEDMNADGVQDSGEPGIDGVTVELFKADGTSMGTKQTANGGQYLFDNLVPGDYYVEFTLPSGYVFSPKDQGGDDAKDSDADTATGKTDVTTLSSGENDPTWDAGMYQKASIGDFVWWDLDEDGVQDAGEPGLEGVTVTLKDANGATVGTTTTDSNGAYSFDNLVPGDYTVVFTPLSSDWTISPKDQGNDDAKDSDANPATGETDTVTLSSGETDNTVDAGMSIPSSYTITKENTTADNELTPGDAISFTITIENTGKTWLAVVPLQDTYDTDYLTYVNADPASVDNNDDGQIDWSDVTGTGQLAPGDSISIIVNFTAKAPTDQLPNHETINTATAHDVLADPDGPNGPNGAVQPLADQSDDAAVQILNPVGEPMGGFSAIASRGAVQLRWQSESESNILGYNILRSSDGRHFERVNGSLIFARNAGGDMGANYRFIDRGLSNGVYTYQIEIVLLNGGVERYGNARVVINSRF